MDGITKAEYVDKFDENVADLIARKKRFRYNPQPVRRTYIPKTNGKLRPLCIPAYEDRLVQSIIADNLNEIYEERFLDCSLLIQGKQERASGGEVHQSGPS